VCALPPPAGVLPNSPNDIAAEAAKANEIKLQAVSKKSSPSKLPKKASLLKEKSPGKNKVKAIQFNSFGGGVRIQDSDILSMLERVEPLPAGSGAQGKLLQAAANEGRRPYFDDPARTAEEAKERKRKRDVGVAGRADAQAAKALAKAAMNQTNVKNEITGDDPGGAARATHKDLRNTRVAVPPVPLGCSKCKRSTNGCDKCRSANGIELLYDEEADMMVWREKGDDVH